MNKQPDAGAAFQAQHPRTRPSRARVTNAGPTSERYRLGDNELLTLFAGLRVRVYRDEARAGAVERGLRDVAQLVAQRPAD